MTQQQLENALDDLAANWRKAPHLSNDFCEGSRYGELKDALKKRFGISKQIEAVNGSTDYQVV